MDSYSEPYSRSIINRTSTLKETDSSKSLDIFSNDPRKQLIFLHSLKRVHRSLTAAADSINNNEGFNSDGMESTSDSGSSSFAMTPHGTSRAFDSDPETDATSSSTCSSPTRVISDNTEQPVTKIKRKLQFNTTPFVRRALRDDNVPPTVEGTIVKEIVTNNKINIKINNSLQKPKNSETGKTTKYGVNLKTFNQYKIPADLSVAISNKNSCQRPTKLDLSVDDIDSVIKKNMQHNLAESPPKPPRSGKLIWSSTLNQLIENPNFEFNTTIKNDLSSNKTKQNNSNEISNRPELKRNFTMSPDEILLRQRNPERLFGINSYLYSPIPFSKFKPPNILQNRVSYPPFSPEYKDDQPKPLLSSDSNTLSSCSSSSQINNIHTFSPTTKSKKENPIAPSPNPNYEMIEPCDSAPCSIIISGGNKNELSDYDDANIILKSGFLSAKKICISPIKSNIDNINNNTSAKIVSKNSSENNGKETPKFTNSTMKCLSRKVTPSKLHLERLCTSPDTSMPVSTLTNDNDHNNYNEETFLKDALGEMCEEENISPAKTTPNETNNRSDESLMSLESTIKHESRTLSSYDASTITGTDSLSRNTQHNSGGDSSINTIDASRLISRDNSSSSRKSGGFGRLLNSAYRSLRKSTRFRKEIKKNVTPENVNDENQTSDNGMEKNEIYEKVKQEQAKQKQLVNAREYCRTKKKFQDSDEQVEIERHLVIAKHQERAYLNELEAFDYQLHQPVHDIRVDGNVTINDIVIHVNEDLDDDDRVLYSQYYFVVISHKTKIFATEAKVAANGVVGFRGHTVVFENLCFNFKIKIEVFGMKIRKSHKLFSFEEKYNIQSGTSTDDMRCLPPEVLLSPRSLFKRKFSPQTDDLDSYFVIQGFLELGVNNLKQTGTFHLIQVPKSSLLTGEISVDKLSYINISSYINTGFLDVVDDCGYWNQRWCKLTGYYLNYWKDEQESSQKEPVRTIDLRECIDLQFSNMDRGLCGRRNTILIQTARVPMPFDQNTFLMTCTPELTYIKHFLHARVASIMTPWRERLEEVFYVLQQWNSTVNSAAIEV